MRKIEIDRHFYATISKAGNPTFGYSASDRYRIELKNVKECGKFSEGTVAFTASLYVNGRKAGAVENDGRGGCNVLKIDGDRFPGLEDTLYEEFGECRLGLDMVISNLAGVTLDAGDVFRRNLCAWMPKNAGAESKAVLVCEIIRNFKKYGRFWA